MFKYLFSFLFAFSFAASAQTPGCPTIGLPNCTVIQQFNPVGVITNFSANAVSSSLGLPSTGQTLNAVIQNSGPSTVYVALGNSSVVATLSSTPILSGQTWVTPQGIATTVAAITSSGTAILNIQSGTGAPTIVAGQFIAAGGVVGVLGNVASVPGLLTPYPLDTTVVTTAGTPVTAILAGHCTFGCFIAAYPTLTATICVNETGNATTSNDGTTYCLSPGQNYEFNGQSSPVSVNSTTNGATFYGREYH